MKLKVIDLFAGIGGIRLGFQQAFQNDIEFVLSCEWNKSAQETYKANFGEKPVGDIRKLKAEDVPAFDICLAGYPCQAFSVQGKKKGFSDNRGTLFEEVIRLCDYHKPAVIMCENVKGLVIHNNGKTFKTIQEKFKEIGYSFDYAVLKSSNFGVPQWRPRVYHISFRNDIYKGFIFPTKTDDTKRLKDILEPVVDNHYYLTQQQFDACVEHKRKQKAKGNGFGYVIRDINSVGATLSASVAGLKQNLIVDEKNWTPDKNNKKVRVLTVKECIRMQSFPEEFIFPVSVNQAYKQLGNSVTVNVIKEIAENIKKYL